MALSKLDTALVAATAETGLGDFGPDDFREPLAFYLDLLETLPLTQSGLGDRRALVHRSLVNRLRFAQALIDHPEILEEDVSDPIVILGFPRSGTTALQRMMSADPDVHGLWTWQAYNPAPFPGEGENGTAERIAYAKMVEDAVRTSDPDYFAAHPPIAEDAEEDFHLHFLAFEHRCLFVFAPVQNYVDYLRSLKQGPSYRYTSQLIRYLQWQQGGRQNKRWVLKSPTHIGSIEVLLESHPGATFFYPRRDYADVLGSFCYLIDSLSKHAYSSFDRQALGRVAINFWGFEVQRFRETKQRLGKDFPIYEIPYQDLLRDPLPHIREIHRRAGSELSVAGEAAIRKWIADNPQNKHGKYSYRLEDYGITRSEIDATFGRVDD